MITISAIQLHSNTSDTYKIPRKGGSCHDNPYSPLILHVLSEDIVRRSIHDLDSFVSFDAVSERSKYLRQQAYITSYLNAPS